MLPDDGLVMGFRYAGSATLVEAETARRLPDSVITGLRTTVRDMRTSANGGIVLARFRAAGAASFFGEPLHHLFGRTRALDEVIDGHEVVCTSGRIAAATSDAERVALVEQFLVRRHRPATPDPIVSGALRAISAGGGGIRISAIARDLRVGQDTLEKRFRRVVGASPKQFATIVRLRRAVDLSKESPSLTALALDAGYYDQSHFIRDFRSITGTAPGEFLGGGSRTFC